MIYNLSVFVELSFVAIDIVIIIVVVVISADSYICYIYIILVLKYTHSVISMRVYKHNQVN